jgi:hypothetical protein
MVVHRFTGVVYAMKCMSKSLISQHGQQQHVENERTIMQQIDVGASPFPPSASLLASDGPLSPTLRGIWPIGASSVCAVCYSQAVCSAVYTGAPHSPVHHRERAYPP